jgi:hypothetical protein
MKVTVKYANNSTRVVELDDLLILRLAAEKADLDDANEREKTKSKPVQITALEVT